MIKSFRGSVTGRYLLCFGCITLVSIALSKVWLIWIGVPPLSMIKFEQETGAVLLGAAGYVREAVAIVDEEEDRVIAERDAFERFSHRVESRPIPTGSATAAGSVTISMTNSTAHEHHLQMIRQAYRETVMAVPHYEDEYNESLCESMAVELTPDLATAVVNGREFSAPLKQALIQQSLSASQDRRSFLNTVMSEHRALETAHTRLYQVDRRLSKRWNDPLDEASFSNLVSRDQELRQMLSECEQLLTDRQQQLHVQNRPRTKRLFVQQYFYQRMEISFPVLAATLEYIQEIRERRRAILREITRQQ